MSEDISKQKYTNGFLKHFNIGDTHTVYFTKGAYYGVPSREEALKIAQEEVNKIYDKIEYWEEFSQLKRFAQVQELEDALNAGEMGKASTISKVLLYNAQWDKK